MRPPGAYAARRWTSSTTTRTSLFFSLEFDTLIRVHRFASRRLFNFHFSKLPKYRGMYTAAHPILNGETDSGVTLHLMDDGIDTGDIIDVWDVPIGPDDTVRDLYFNNLAAAKALFAKNVERLVAGDFIARPQPLAGATYLSPPFDRLRRAAARSEEDRLGVSTTSSAPSPSASSRCRSIGAGASGAPQITDQRSTQRAGRLVEETEALFRIASIDNDVLLFKDYAAAALGGRRRRRPGGGRRRRCAHVPDVNLRNRNGWSALIIAAYHGQVEAMRRLLAAGADPDGTNYKGTPVLMYALSRYEQTREAAGFDLIASAARRLDGVDHTGRTIRDWIAEKGFPELLDRLAR